MATTLERKTRPGKFVWFEHASRDSKRAQDFYREVLGWKTERWQGGYDMIMAGETPESMIGGYRQLETPKEIPHWISYVSVEDVDLAAKEAAVHGGKVIEEPHEIPGVGRTARIRDPQGAELYFFHSAGGDPPDPSTHGEPRARSFFWNELHTNDPASALSFYEKVLGYTHETMTNLGPGNDYHVLSRDGVGRCGMTDKLSKEESRGAPHWLPYVAVDDADAALARAKELGGKVHAGPYDIPGVGRMGVIEDPTGAVLAVMKAIPPTGKTA